VLNPSRPRVLLIALIAVTGLVLGLATDVGLFGWSLAALLVLYLAIAATTRLVHGDTSPTGANRG
jgi:hypothetical protein